MIRPGVVSDAVVYELVGIARSLGPELPYSPVLAMLGVEEIDETIERVAICALRVGLRGARARSSVLVRYISGTGGGVYCIRCDYVVGHIAQVQARLGMSSTGTRYDLP